MFFLNVLDLEVFFLFDESGQKWWNVFLLFFYFWSFKFIFFFGGWVISCTFCRVFFYHLEKTYGSEANT